MKFIYPAIFSKTTEGTFEARFPDLECCTATGETLDDCIENANQAAYAKYFRKYPPHRWLGRINTLTVPYYL